MTNFPSALMQHFRDALPLGMFDKYVRLYNLYASGIMPFRSSTVTLEIYLSDLISDMVNAAQLKGEALSNEIALLDAEIKEMVYDKKEWHPLATEQLHFLNQGN